MIYLDNALWKQLKYIRLTPVASLIVAKLFHSVKFYLSLKWNKERSQTRPDYIIYLIFKVIFDIDSNRVEK